MTETVFPMAQHPSQMTDVFYQQLYDLMQHSWAPETSASPDYFSNTENARIEFGQCAVTAVLIQTLLGGELIRGLVSVDGEPQGSHYWNHFPEDDFEADFTRNQFPESAVLTERKTSSREYILSNDKTAARYELLLQRFLSHLESLPGFNKKDNNFIKTWKEFRDYMTLDRDFTSEDFSKFVSNL